MDLCMGALKSQENPISIKVRGIKGSLSKSAVGLNINDVFNGFKWLI